MPKLALVNPPAAFKDWQFEPGCYVDGARGVYAIDQIVLFAEDKGFLVSPCSCDVCKGNAEGSNVLPSNYAGCEFGNELEDEIDDWLNSRFEILGHYWGRSEQGDWGLWPIEEN